MALTGWLIDKSALARLGQSPQGDVWAERIERGMVHIGTVTRLEIGYSARSASQLRETMLAGPIAALVVEHLTPAAEERALEVQQLLADRGQHRAPSLADLLLAASAELANLSVLHVGKDFDLIAEITGQSVERLQV